MKKPEIKQLFLIINNCYQNFQIDEIKISIWLDLLQEIPFDVAQRNLRKHIKESKFVPTPADIICHDPDQFTDFAQLQNDTEERMKELEEWKEKAVPMPEHIKTMLLKEGVSIE